jgi:hypothetical protein
MATSKDGKGTGKRRRQFVAQPEDAEEGQGCGGERSCASATQAEERKVIGARPGPATRAAVAEVM